MIKDGIAPEVITTFAEIPMKTGVAVYLVHRFYCKPMRRIGQCTEHCEDCRERLTKALEAVNNPRVRNTEAALTWHLKEAVADVEEETELPQVTYRTNKLGERIEGNPFEVLAQL